MNKILFSLALIVGFGLQASAASLVDVSCKGKGASFSGKMMYGENPGASSVPLWATLRIKAVTSDGAQVKGEVKLRGQMLTRDHMAVMGYQQVQLGQKSYTLGVTIENSRQGAITVIEGTLEQAGASVFEDGMICVVK